MEAFNKWFTDMTSTPAGSVLLFILVFVSRLAIDRWDRKRSAKRSNPRKKAA